MNEGGRRGILTQTSADAKPASLLDYDAVHFGNRIFKALGKESYL